MNIHFSGQHMAITEAIEEYIRQKFKVLSRHFDSILDVHVHMKVEKQQHFIEAKIDIRGASLFASAQQSDMYKAIEQVTQKLDRQIVRHKEKFKDHHPKEITHHMLDK